MFVHRTCGIGFGIGKRSDSVWRSAVVAIKSNYHVHECSRCSKRQGWDTVYSNTFSHSCSSILIIKQLE